MFSFLSGRFILPSLFILGIITGYVWRDKGARLEQEQFHFYHAKQLALAQERATIIYQELTARLNDLAIEYEATQQHTYQLEADIANRIDAGTLRLRQPWRAENCEPGRVSNTATTPAVDHENTANRAHLAAAIIRAGIEADNQLNACQNVIQEYHRLSAQ